MLFGGPRISERTIASRKPPVESSSSRMREAGAGASAFATGLKVRWGRSNTRCSTVRRTGGTCVTTGFLAGRGSAGGDGRSGSGGGDGISCSVLLGMTGGAASSGSPSASRKRRMAVSVCDGGGWSGSRLAMGSPVVSARFSSLRFSRASFDFWTIQLIMLIKAISRRMMNYSMTV